MSENLCQEPALFLFTWLGNEKEFICLEHAEQLMQVARAIGPKLYLSMLSNDKLLEGVQCSQKVKEES